MYSMRKFMETKTGKAIYVGAVTVVLSAVGSWAVLAHQDDPTTTKKDGGMAPAPSTSGKTMMGDSHFAREAAQGGMAEVKFGKLAEDKGTNEAVKNFGKRMVEDHSKADDQLKSVASKQNLTLPNGLSAKDQATYDRLSKLNGTAFDRAYAKDMVKDHEADIAAFKRESTTGTDDSLKSFASDTLPTLQDHLKQAKEMMKTVEGSSASKKTKANPVGR
jgi:putative membrane protein